MTPIARSEKYECWRKAHAVNVRQMHFDEWNVDSRNGVAQGDAGVGIGRRVDDDEADAFAARSVHAFDQGALVVALEVSVSPRPLRHAAPAPG